MSAGEPSSPLVTVPVDEILLDEDYATKIEIEYAYMLRSRDGSLSADPGRACITLSDEDGTKVADMTPEEGRRIAAAISKACDLAEAAKQHAPDRVPAEWTEGPA